MHADLEAIKYILPKIGRRRKNTGKGSVKLEGFMVALAASKYSLGT